MITIKDIKQGNKIETSLGTIEVIKIETDLVTVSFLGKIYKDELEELVFFINEEFFS